MEKPSVVKNEHLDYLDKLRESGNTNMFGARPWLMSKFPELSGQEAVEVLGYWMESFGEDRSEES